MSKHKTWTAKAADLQNSDWFAVDATDQVLGRLASGVAKVLRGKHKPTFTPHLNSGDHVIVINAARVKVTGTKGTTKEYTRYTGYPGGLRRRSLNTAQTSAHTSASRRSVGIWCARHGSRRPRMTSTSMPLQR